MKKNVLHRGCFGSFKCYYVIVGWIKTTKVGPLHCALVITLLHDHNYISTVVVECCTKHVYTGNCKYRELRCLPAKELKKKLLLKNIELRLLLF